MMTVMGDALVDGLSDAGSTPARSTKKAAISLRNQGDCRFFVFELFSHNKHISLLLYKHKIILK